jgi:endonuclease/exonuclease/phosphatase family metal-dependent hydrolase
VRVLVLLLLLGASGACAPAADEAPIRVITFNIRYNNPGDSLHAWPYRKDRAAGILRFHEADLIGVQEALVDQLRDLDGLLPGFKRLGVGRDDGREAGEFSAIYYRTNRFEPLEDGTFWLSPTPEVPGSMGWDAAITRICTFARLRDRVTGRSFLHLNTHFDHRGERARLESARLIATRATSLAGDDPIVLTGDLNFDPAAPGYALLAERLADTRELSQTGHHGPEATFYGFTAGGPPGRRIDFVFVSPDTAVLRHATLSESWDGAFASDHLPVFAEIVFSR